VGGLQPEADERATAFERSGGPCRGFKPRTVVDMPTCTKSLRLDKNLRFLWRAWRGRNKSLTSDRKSAHL
jgi:hypothetical protein